MSICYLIINSVDPLTWAATLMILGTICIWVDISKMSKNANFNSLCKISQHWRRMWRNSGNEWHKRESCFLPCCIFLNGVIHPEVLHVVALAEWGTELSRVKGTGPGQLSSWKGLKAEALQESGTSFPGEHLLAEDQRAARSKLEGVLQWLVLSRGSLRDGQWGSAQSHYRGWCFMRWKWFLFLNCPADVGCAEKRI